MSACFPFSCVYRHWSKNDFVIPHWVLLWGLLSEKWNWKSLSRVQLFVTPWTVHGILQARILEWVTFPFFRESSQPGIEPRYPTLQADSLPAEPQEKPKNTGVGSLSLLQWIFLTQESNWGLLHCRWILYQLSHEGSPKSLILCHSYDILGPNIIINSEL